MKLDAFLYEEIDDRTEDIRDLAVAHPDIWKNFLDRFELSWIYHENALEGIVVTHAEITSALKGRPISPDTYGPIRNLKIAIDLIKREARLGSRVDMALIRRIHAALGSNDPNFQPTRYRHEIPLHRAYFHEIAQPEHIAGRVNRLLDWAAANDPEDENAIRFAAQFHHEFMSIFPFAEHSGQTGRLLVNYVLLRHGYMPVLFHATERQRYYDTLRQDKNLMEQTLVAMMRNCIENGRHYIRDVLEEEAKQKIAAIG